LSVICSKVLNLGICMTNTLFTGKHLIHLREIPSTNTYAKAYISNSSPIDGTVILADKQTAGRGQAGNTWVAEPGQNLTLSIVYHAGFLAATRQFDLSIGLALGVRDTVEALLNSIDCRIKWPNDILVEGKKVAGILIENTIRGNHLQYTIAGIGLNVNQKTFPPDLVLASSLSTIAGKDFPVDKVLEILLSKIEVYFLQLRNGTHKNQKEMYLQQLYGMGEELRFEDIEGVFTGTIIGVDDTGKLLIKKNNEVATYDFKEVGFL
jgi:BirA family transcriptional regulator, biotin operon repressor / biotin---[acetyl-CoA-carboxylase] ligase